jgi:hypothetical protein
MMASTKITEGYGLRTSSDDSQEPAVTEPAGWAEIVEWTGGLAPEEIESLGAVRELEAVFPLLHALAGRSVRDFLVRAAVLEALVSADRSAFSAEELREILYWLDERARTSVLAALRRSGWLEFEPGAGTTLTDAGRWAYDVLSFLHHRLRESELLPTVAGIEYALEIGMDPIRHLLSMRSRLVSLRTEIDVARASHSEVVLRQAAGRLDAALELSTQIRIVLDRVPLDHAAARQLAREIHELLSRLHGVGSELHRDITEVGRQYLELTAGMTVEQIVRSLMRKSVQELAAVGRDALLPVVRRPPLLTTEVLAHAAETHVARERGEVPDLKFEEPADAPSAEAEDVDLPSEVRRWLADLDGVAAGERAIALGDLVPHEDAGTSFLRASLLALVGDHRPGDGVASQLGALPLDVALQGDGWPEPLVGKPLARLTPGAVVPRPAEGGNG